MMGSRSDILRGVEYMNWYQVIRPIGFSNEKSRFEILKAADESDLRLRDSVPWGLMEKTHQDAMLEESDLQKLVASKHSFGRSYELTDAPMTSNLEVRDNTKTYLSPRSKEFQDENKEIEEIFWWLLKSAHPTCPDDLDLQAIRNALAERKAKLGREKKDMDRSEVDHFDKYGLGLGAKTQHRDSAGDSKKSKPPKNDLFDMIEKLATERMKPEPKLNDLFDKNNPVKGKVGFRRDENGEGPRSFTDLDEVLSFGDLDKDVDFRKYLVMQNRGRYDSKGNFIPGRFDSEGNFTPGRFDALGNFIPGIYDEDGNFISGKYDESGRFIQGTTDSKGNFIPGRLKAAENVESDATGKIKRSRKKSRRRKGDTESDSAASSKSKREKSFSNMTDEERQKYLEDFRKSKRHPEIDYPTCNYPKWIHRLYRMDQVKFGDRIKQRIGVPEYTPPWMMDTLDRVWGTKDPLTRGVKPSNDPRRRKSRFNEKGSLIKETTGREGELSKKESRKLEKTSDENRQGRGEDDTGVRANLGGRTVEEGEQEDRHGKDKGLTEGLGGLADFLQGYKKEMVDLARLEPDTDKTRKKSHTSFDIDDLIDQYYDELLKEENIHKHDKERFHKKEIMEEKARRIKERQEAALKKIEDKEKALKQKERMKKEANEANEEKEMKQKAHTENIWRQKELARQQGRVLRPGDKVIGGIKGHDKSSKKAKGRGRDFFNKKATAETEPCAEFKASKLARTRDDECMKRFQVLLGHKSRFFGGTDFSLLAQQIALFRYPPAPPKKTPCERVEVPIC